MPTREFKRLDRVASTVKKALAEPINELARAQAVGLATITEVEVASDLRYGTVHLSIYGERGAEFLRYVNDRAPALQAVLARSLRTRHVPVLTFVADDSIARGDRIAQMLRGVAPSGGHEL